MATGAEGRSVARGTIGVNRLRDSNLALQHINDILEEQSKRIAHAVHDEAGQLLAAVFVRLDQASRELSPTCGTCFEEIKRMLELIEVQLREIAHELRPPVLDDFGLVPALEAFVDRVSKRYGIAITCDAALPHRLPSAIETAIYRIVQECLNNVGKHANATRAKIEIAFAGEQLHGLIQDNGAGFDMNEVLSRRGSRGLGLLGIRERVDSVGGRLSIESVPGNGTTLRFTIPLRG